MTKLFTERHGQGKARTAEVLDDNTRNGLLTLLNARLDEEWFGLSFPSACADGYAYAGTDYGKMRGAMSGFGLPWLQDLKPRGPHQEYVYQEAPTDGQVFDLLEYAYEHIAEPSEPSHHSYMGHSHYSYNQARGRHVFTEDVNRIFERNGMAFELSEGEVRRIAPAVLHEALAVAVFQTGDELLDGMLETARAKFLHRDLSARKESLEKLWDAWERLKTVEPGKDKKAQVTAILDKATAEPTLRARLEDEAKKLTDFGNDFMIRHSETTKVPVVELAHVDYLFHRMFAMVRLLLQKSGRLG